MGKRQRRTIGDILKVGLDNGKYCFAKVLDDPLYGFYDHLSDNGALELDEIIKKPFLFKVWVMKDAVTSGRWEKIGKTVLTDSDKETPKFYKKDALDPSKIFIYYKGEDIPAKPSECAGLECAAVWEAEHVEDRLRDHFNGVPNQWVESMKL